MDNSKRIEFMAKEISNLSTLQASLDNINAKVEKISEELEGIQLLRDRVSTLEAKIDDLGNRAAIAMQERKERAAQADRAIADIEKRVINVKLNTNRKIILITGIPEVRNERCHLKSKPFLMTYTLRKCLIWKPATDTGGTEKAILVGPYNLS